MKDNQIRNALDTINPTSAQKAKMRAALEARLPQEKPARREYQARPTPTRSWTWIPAMVALFAVVLIGIFVLVRPGMGHAELAAPDSTVPESTATQSTVPQFASRSVQDFFESAQYRASLEWNAYLETCEESNEGLPSPYPYYGCSSAEMVEQLDALCETYGLRLEEELIAVNDYDKLMEIVCVDTIFRPISGVSQDFTNYGNSYYSDGSFEVSGETLMQYDGSPWFYPITFCFYYLMKPTFYDVFLDIGDITQYEYWEYTTQNGDELLLAMHQDQALILADRGDSVILIFTTDVRVGDVRYGELSMDKTVMELFAETFDYTLPPDGGLAPIPDPTAVAAAQMSVYSMPTAQSTVVGTIEKGTLLNPERQEYVNGKAWGYISGDNAQGWIDMTYVELTYATKSDDKETSSAENDYLIPSAYETVLEKYVTAINERWDGARCAKEDISILVRDVESLDSLGYALMDLDSDGVDELLLISDDESQSIFDLYTLLDGEVEHPVSGWERSSYFLRDGGRLLNIASESAACTNYVFNRLSGGNLVQEEIIRYDALQDAENPWFMGFAMNPVTQEEAEAAISAYTIDRIPLVLLSQVQ